MASEDEIAGAYEDYLNNRKDYGLVSRLFGLIENKDGKVAVIKLEDYEREHLIRMICNTDFTGEHDIAFEDLRKNVSTNDSCG